MQVESYSCSSNLNSIIWMDSLGTCLITILAIWMTGSFSGSGNIPFLPAHSMSKLRILKGAMSDHSPSGSWEMKLFHATSTSIWQRESQPTKYGSHYKFSQQFQLKKPFNSVISHSVKNTVGSRYPEIWGMSGNFPDNETTFQYKNRYLVLSPGINLKSIEL